MAAVDSGSTANQMGRMTGTLVVKLAFDSEAQVWFVEASDVPGLNLEAASLDDLRAALPGAILDLLEATAERDFDIPIEIIAHASSRVRGRALAA